MWVSPEASRGSRCAARKNEPERNRVFARRAMDERSVFTVPATDSHCDFGAKWQKEQTRGGVPRYLRCMFRGKSDAHRRKDVRAVARGAVSPACSLLIGRSSCACCVRTVRVVFNEARWIRFRLCETRFKRCVSFVVCVFGRIVSWKCQSEKSARFFG